MAARLERDGSAGLGGGWRAAPRGRAVAALGQGEGRLGGGRWGCALLRGQGARRDARLLHCAGLGCGKGTCLLLWLCFQSSLRKGRSPFASPCIPSRPAAGPAQVGLRGPRPGLPLHHLPRQPLLSFGNIPAGLSIWLLAVLSAFFKKACIAPNRFSRRAADRLELLKTSTHCRVTCLSVLKTSWYLQILVY